MIRHTLNRLWVRITLSIIAIIFVVTVLPSASLLLIQPRDIADEQIANIEQFNVQSGLGLSARQIEVLANERAERLKRASLSVVIALNLRRRFKPIRIGCARCFTI